MPIAYCPIAHGRLSGREPNISAMGSLRIVAPCVQHPPPTQYGQEGHIPAWHRDVKAGKGRGGATAKNRGSPYGMVRPQKAKNPPATYSDSLHNVLNWYQIGHKNFQELLRIFHPTEFNGYDVNSMSNEETVDASIC